MICVRKIVIDILEWVTFFVLVSRIYFLGTDDIMNATEKKERGLGDIFYGGFGSYSGP